VATPSAARPEPANRRGRATQERIETAAQLLFVEHGLDFTLEDVARAARTTRMTVYRHVGTREELVTTLVLEAQDRLGEGLELILDGQEPFADRLVEAMVYVVTAARSTPVGRALALGAAAPTGRWRAVDPEGRVLTDILEFLRPRLVEASRDVPLRGDVDTTLAWLLRQVQLYLLVPPAYGDDAEVLRQEVRTFVVPAVLAEPEPAGAAVTPTPARARGRAW